MDEFRRETRHETVDRVMKEIITDNWNHYRGDRITDEEMSMWLISNHAMVENETINIPARVVDFFIETFALETKRLSDIIDKIDKMKSLNQHLLKRQQKQKAEAADRAFSVNEINGGFHRQRTNKHSKKSRKSKSRRTKTKSRRH